LVAKEDEEARNAKIEADKKEEEAR